MAAPTPTGILPSSLHPGDSSSPFLLPGEAINETSQFLIYRSEDGRTKIDVMLEAETLRLNPTEAALGL